MKTGYDFVFLEQTLHMDGGNILTVATPTQGCSGLIAITLLHDALMQNKKVCYYSEKYTTRELMSMLRVRNYNTLYKKEIKEGVDELTLETLQNPTSDKVVVEMEKESLHILENGEDMGSFALVGKGTVLDDVVGGLIDFMEMKDYDILIYEPINEYLKPTQLEEYSTPATILQMVEDLERIDKVGVVMDCIAYSRNMHGYRTNNHSVYEQQVKTNTYGKGYTMVSMPDTPTDDDKSYIFSITNGEEIQHHITEVDKDKVSITLASLKKYG